MVPVVLGFSLITTVASSQIVVPQVNCPEGYDFLLRLAERNYCFSSADVSCASGQYPCGANGTSCCNVSEDNTCDAGFVACRPAGSDPIYGNARPYCCEGGIQTATPVVPDEPTEPATTPAFRSGVALLCRNVVLDVTGRSEFWGAGDSCSKAYDAGSAEANRIGCAGMGNSNWIEYDREIIRTPSCP